jgi:hypothetical protein
VIPGNSPHAPAARATLIASRTIDAATFARPGFACAQRDPATTGAPWAVEMVVASGDGPRSSTRAS